ncbi:MAG: hypothetical protein GY898_06390 [Proteobacteria bacterium]|nr:hypothetical protein [Pseudomonadota bacterium]
MTSLRPLLLLVCLTLVGCVTTSATQRDKGFTDSRSTAQALEASFAPRKVAVVVGVGEFTDEAFPPLKWAVDDATEVGRILEDPKYGGFDRVVYLTGAKQARRDRVLAELVALRNDLRRQDTLVVYVSTHGTMTLDATGDPHLFLVTADTRPGDLRGTAIELAELQTFFSDMRAERKALILDACYNGEAKSALQPTVRQRIDRMEASPVLSRKVRLGESEAHLFASTFGRPAREDDELKHGVYTYHLLDALTWSQQEADGDGDGTITIYEAHDHARTRTLAYTLGAQVPEAYFRVVGHNDLVLVGAPEARAKAELGAVYWYGSADEELDGATLMIDGATKGALPGTFPVTPGRHRVKVVGHDGSLMQDRVVTIGVGEAVPADTLRSRPVVHNGFLNLGPKARLTPAEGARPLLGRAHVGVELGGGYRFMGPLRGLTLSGGFGYAPHQARFVTDGTTRFEPRHAIWGHAQVGYRLLVPRGSLGAGYRLRLTGITALQDASCGGHAACDGWLWPTQALALDQTVSLGRRWSLYVEEEVGISVLDVDGTGPRARADLGLRIGIEVGL